MVKKYFLAVLFFVLGVVTYAHPHSFVDVQATIHVDDYGINQIEFLWVQNDTFGEDMMKTNPEQYLKWCWEWFKEQIIDDNYCCTIYVDDKKIEADHCKLNKIKLLPLKNKALYYVTVDVSIPVTSKVSVIDIVMEDADYYVAFSWLKDKVTISGKKQLIRNMILTNDNQTLRFILAPSTREINEALPESYNKTQKSRKLLPNSFLQMQFKWNRKIHNYLQMLKMKFSWSVFLLLFGAAATYGIFHAAGPGHGKGLLAAYFLSGKHSALDVPKMAFMVTLIHTGAAFLLILLFYLMLNVILPYQRVKAQSYMSFVIALCVIGIGIFMLFKSNKNNLDSAAKSSGRGLILLAGMFPCPLSIALMLGCMAAGIWQIGIFLVLGVSFGTFVILLTVAGICYYSSSSIPKFLDQRKINRKYVDISLKLLQCTLIIFSGAILAILNWPM